MSSTKRNTHVTAYSIEPCSYFGDVINICVIKTCDMQLFALLIYKYFLKCFLMILLVCLRAIYHAKHIEYTSHFCKMLKLELKIMMKNCALYICQCCHYLQEFFKKKQFVKSSPGFELGWSRNQIL